ncbi:Uncharacterised protein [Candidatus Burarchaeum australiense]|nr:Uncharacterised protein [Candidatus Burarchaeum australiense]
MESTTIIPNNLISKEVRTEMFLRTRLGRTFFHRHMPTVVAFASPRVKRGVIRECIRAAFDGFEPKPPVQTKRIDLKEFLASYKWEETQSREAIIAEVSRHPAECMDVLEELINKKSPEFEYWTANREASALIVGALEGILLEDLRRFMSLKRSLIISRAGNIAKRASIVIKDREVCKEAERIASLKY